MKEKVNALFLGLVRTPEVFRKSILDLVEMRKEGLINQIIFSTWDYEVKKNPDIVSFLEKNGVKIIASEEPKDRGEGNIWCQMKSLDVALNSVDIESFVFKNRSDIYVNPEFLRNLIKNRKDILKISDHLPKGDIFKYKIWVHYYEFKTPFHMGEECLFGHSRDMRLLVNYDRSYDELKVGNAVSHIRRFIHPFLQHYPVLNLYLKTYSKDSWLKTLAIKFSRKIFEIRGTKIARKISAQNKISNLKKKLEDPTFIDILAIYYSILNSHFYIDGNSVQNLVVNVADRPESIPGVELNPREFEKNIEIVTHPSRPGQIYVYDSVLLSNLVNKKINPSEKVNSLYNSIDKFNAGRL